MVLPRILPQIPGNGLCGWRNNPPLLSFHPCPWVHSSLLPLPVPRSESSAQPVLTLQKLMKPNRKSFMDLPDHLDGLLLSQPISQLEGEASGCDG